MAAATTGRTWYCTFCLAFRSLNHTDLLAHWFNQTPVICPVQGCGVRLPCHGIAKMHAETRHGRVDPNSTFHCLGCNCHFSSQLIMEWHHGKDLLEPPKSKCASCPFIGGCAAQTLLHFAEQHA